MLIMVNMYRFREGNYTHFLLASFLTGGPNGEGALNYFMEEQKTISELSSDICFLIFHQNHATPHAWFILKYGLYFHENCRNMLPIITLI